MDESAFYCDMKAMSKNERERYDSLRKKLESAIQETKELTDGYVFRWKSEEVSLMEVAEWVDKERKCCPFFDFAIGLERNGGPLTLTLGGQEGVKEFIRMEFGINEGMK